MKLSVGSLVNWAEPKDNVGWEDNYCIQCGRKTGKHAFAVHLSNGGTILLPNTEDSSSQGYWFVGSECAKKFDSAVLISW
jgi:hypothetical protein